MFFEKIRLKREIKKSRRMIELLEQKRSRSQAALVEAILTHSTPADDDVDFFNMYTERINAEREKMHALINTLNAKK